MTNRILAYGAAAALLLVTCASAQKKHDLFSAQHKAGIFVMVNPAVSATATASLEKQAGTGAWKHVAQVAMPASLAAFQGSLAVNALLFPDYPYPTPVDAQKIWEKVTRYGTLDSLSLWAASPCVLLSLGAAYLDTAVAPNTYTSRVTVKDGAGTVTGTGASRQVKYPQPAVFGKIKFIRSTSGADNIYSEWTAARPVPGQVRVLRADATIGRFEQIAVVKGFVKRNDSLFIMIKDTTLTPGVQYRYCLEPIDLFERPGPRSDTVALANWTINGLVLRDFSVENEDSSNGIRLRFSISDPGLASVVKIFRSVSVDTGYTLIAELPSNQQVFVDNTGTPMQKYYYRLKFADAFGNETGLSAYGFAAYASTAQPFSPTLLSATGTATGVLLRWTCFDANADGFYVSRSDGASLKLDLLTPLLRLKRDSVYSYLDSSRSLKGNRFYSYAVCVESKSHIKSGYSDTLTARPLLPTVPLTPSDIRITAEENGIRLSWTDLSSFDEDIAGYYVYRKERGSKNDYRKVTPSMLRIGHNYYLDTTCTEGVEYEYAVTSRDIFGNESGEAGFVTAVMALKLPVPPAEVKLYPREKDILLRWDPVQPGITNYLIYRYTRGSVPVRIGTVKQQRDPEFTDAKVEKGKLYFYFVTTKNEKGRESAAGPESSVRFGW